MYTGNLIFSQVIAHLPMHTFRRCVQRYRGHNKIKTFTRAVQFRCMAFAQLTYRDSLRDIEACLRAQPTKLYHMGIRGGISRNTLANANQTRDWRLYADFAHALIHIDQGKLHDVNVLNLNAAFFVTRAKSNVQFRRLYSHPIDKDTGLRCDQTGVPGFYPDKLRRIKYHDNQTSKTLVFLSNNFTLPALTICELYRCRWQREPFFKWSKQHLRIQSFFGTSANAVKTQIWRAVFVYVLSAIIKKRLNIKPSLYTMLQILSVTVFEQIPLNQVFSDYDGTMQNQKSPNQLFLFE